jgi:hypothetical protein
MRRHRAAGDAFARHDYAAASSGEVEQRHLVQRRERHQVEYRDGSAGLCESIMR